MAVAGADDYFVACIEPLLESNPQEMIHILSLGGQDAEFELRIARDLRRRDREGFRVLFPVSSSEHGDAIFHQAGAAGIDQELAPFSPGAAREGQIAREHFEDVAFHAIIGDGAFARSERVEALIDALASATARGVRLAVAERIGEADGRTAREMGERIWQLMPERYKFDHVTQTNASNYWNEDSPSAGRPDLLAMLRARFDFEDFAAFGHLVDRFVGREIGSNFDPTDARDRRFIEQIANLDEAKLDEGGLQPLHMVARLTATTPTRGSTATS